MSAAASPPSRWSSSAEGAYRDPASPPSRWSSSAEGAYRDPASPPHRWSSSAVGAPSRWSSSAEGAYRDPVTPPAAVTFPAAPFDAETDPVQGDEPALDPAALATAWLPGEGEDRMLMTLATIDAHGFPRTRTVMLSEFDGERFFFHTDARSAKVADLARDPRVGLTIVWPAFSRQLVVQGTAEPAPAEELADAYAKRSPYLRQLAWLNTAEFARRPLAEREAEWRAWGAQHPEPAQPREWVGFGVRPHRMLFWTSHPDAASRRIEYTRTPAGWESRYLPG